MKKSEIISRTLKEFWNEPYEDGDTPLEEVDAENPIVVALIAALKSADPDAEVQTCDDFSHFRIECCDTCHPSYPHYDMALIDLEGGGNAWICCALDSALNPGEASRRTASRVRRSLDPIGERDGLHQPRCHTCPWTC
jgi:hypothetical protein